MTLPAQRATARVSRLGGAEGDDDGAQRADGIGQTVAGASLEAPTMAPNNLGSQSPSLLLRLPMPQTDPAPCRASSNADNLDDDGVYRADDVERSAAGPSLEVGWGGVLQRQHRVVLSTRIRLRTSPLKGKLEVAPPLPIGNQGWANASTDWGRLGCHGSMMWSFCRRWMGVYRGGWSCRRGYRGRGEGSVDPLFGRFRSRDYLLLVVLNYLSNPIILSHSRCHKRAILWSRAV